MGRYAFTWLCYISNNNDWLLGLIGWKVTVISSNFIALMLILEYGNEYSCYCKIFTIEKRISTFIKRKKQLFWRVKK